MITINLLPVELRPIKRTPIPYILCVALMIGAVLLCFQIFVADTLAYKNITDDLAKNKEELDSLKPSVDKYNELYEEKKLLATQLETINDIVSDRIYWSYQLHNLARLSEDKNMWFDKIQVKTVTTNEMRSEYNPQTDKTTKKRVRISTPVLSITGFVASGVDGKFSISDFMAAADNDPEFSAQFKQETGSFVDTEIKDARDQGQKVREFELKYNFNSGGGSQ